MACSALLSRPPSRQVPLWAQKTGDQNADGFIVWDYHVILVQRDDQGQHWVWDLDTLLDLPTSFENYSELALQPANTRRWCPPSLHR